jgi:hypothetical protein
MAEGPWKSRRTYDRNKPVVDIEIRNEVVRSDLGEASVVSPNAKDGSEDGDSGIGGEDLLSVSLVEDDGVRVKVVGELGIVLLSRGVPDQVHRPSEELKGNEQPSGLSANRLRKSDIRVQSTDLLSDQVDHDVKRSVSDSLGELGLLLLGDVHAITAPGIDHQLQYVHAQQVEEIWTQKRAIRTCLPLSRRKRGSHAGLGFEERRPHLG